MRRLSKGVLVALGVAIAAATVTSAANGSLRISELHAAAPVHLTLALERDGTKVRIANDDFAVTLEF